MNTKRLYILLVAMAANTAVALATNAVRLCIELTTGGKQTFTLSEQPAVSFSADSLYIETSAVKVSVGMPCSVVKQMYFDVADGTSAPDPSVEAIDDIRDDRPETGVDLSFSFDGRVVLIATQDAMPRVAVYAIGGQQVAPPVLQGAHSLAIDMDGLPRGVYVIQAGQRAIKVAVK